MPPLILTIDCHCNIVFFLLDEGHEAENLLKRVYVLLHYHFPMEDTSESFGNIF